MGLFDRFFGPPSEAQFADILIAALRQAGDDRAFDYDAPLRCIRAFRDGKWSNVINLVNLYKAYCPLSRGARKQWLRNTCIGFMNQMEVPTDFEDAKPDLRPAVRSRAMLDFVRLQAEAEGVEWVESPSVSISDYLSGCLVYDLPQSMRFVSQENLDSWGVPLYLAMEAAIQNLEEQPPEAFGRIGDALYIFQSGDAYDATRMLSRNLMRRLTVKGNPVALPINRDCLMVTGSEDDSGLALMATIAEDQAEAGRPVCSIPHVFVGDEWRVWSLPKDHAAEERFRGLAIRNIGSEYAEQEQLLQKWLETKGIDAFVASYSGLEHASDGRLRSWCAWSKGVPTWLPRTDIIAFFDPDSNIRTMVEWDRALAEFGSLMRSTECWPPRWAVEEFPDPTRLEQVQLEGW